MQQWYALLLYLLQNHLSVIQFDGYRAMTHFMIVWPVHVVNFYPMELLEMHHQNQFVTCTHHEKIDIATTRKFFIKLRL